MDVSRQSIGRVFLKYKIPKIPLKCFGTLKTALDINRAVNTEHYSLLFTDVGANNIGTRAVPEHFTPSFE